MESNHLQEKFEQAMHSLNGIQRAEPKPFFYTRLKARMENEKGTAEISWLLWRKPMWLIATLILCLVLNTLMIKQITKTNLQQTSVSTSPSLESFATEFELNNSSNY